MGNAVIDKGANYHEQGDGNIFISIHQAFDECRNKYYEGELSAVRKIHRSVVKRIHGREHWNVNAHSDQKRFRPKTTIHCESTAEPIVNRDTHNPNSLKNHNPINANVSADSRAVKMWKTRSFASASVDIKRSNRPNIKP